MKRSEDWVCLCNAGMKYLWSFKVEITSMSISESIAKKRNHSVLSCQNLCCSYLFALFFCPLSFCMSSFISFSMWFCQFWAVKTSITQRCNCVERYLKAKWIDITDFFLFLEVNHLIVLHILPSGLNLYVSLKYTFSVPVLKLLLFTDHT